MSEAWREVARLGNKGERYPHILADSHGWCLRLGPRDREDDKYFSSLGSLLQALSEHLLRRKDDVSARTILETKDLLLQNLKEAKRLGEDLEGQLPGLRQRPLDAAEEARPRKESETPRAVPEIAAVASGNESQAA
jgi:hypothetical protein